MSPGLLADDAVNRHRCGRLDDDDAVKNQVPKRERSAEARAGGGSSVRRSGCHSRVLDYAEAGNVND